jgi:hypothetical protein
MCGLGVSPVSVAKLGQGNVEVRMRKNQLQTKNKGQGEDEEKRFHLNDRHRRALVCHVIDMSLH